uniref:Fluoride-specific ion channel FluC n=1 Tax=Loigolactobacillus rennini TaxID=238013 RepID=A0A1K2I8B4_9LACO|nr:CrcB protein [Loigolactobacillus rennini]
MNYLVVAIAAFLGGSCRYLLSSLTTAFPWGTLMANLIGCFLLIWLTDYLARILPLPKRFVLGAGTGFMGAFTTFSTFSVETIQFINAQQYGLALLYVSCSLLGGLIFGGAGLLVAQQQQVNAHD